jgi:hypothetical protein
MLTLAFVPFGEACCVAGEGKGIGRGSQYLLVVPGKRSATGDPQPQGAVLEGPGNPTADEPSGQRGMGPAVRRHDAMMVRGGGYTAAVVTPPSTTMVCPVMNVDASEAR